MLDPTKSVQLAWKIEWDKNNVNFAIENGLIQKFVWFAIGFSRRGEFERTDICIFHKSKDGVKVYVSE